MKMKRIAAAMLAMMMVVSLAACGTNNENTGASPEESSDVQITTERIDTDTEQTAPTESTTTSAVTDTPEQTTSATTAPEEPVAPEEIPVLNVEPALVMNGCMAFKADGKNYVYNITENEMYETEYDVDDITVLNGCVAVIGNVLAYEFKDIDASIINLKTGEEYTNVRPFFNTNSTSNDLVVGKIDESFSGNTLSIGVLDNKGEWVFPLSADYAICQNDDLKNAVRASYNNGIISFGVNTSIYSYNYDIANDKLIENINIWNLTDDKIIIKENTTAYEYDIITGEKIYIDITPSNMIAEDYYLSKDETKIYDANFNLLEYDLSEYNIERSNDIKGVSEDVMVFVAKNNEGDTYTIVLNKNGEYACEPHKLNDEKEKACRVYFSDNKVIINRALFNDRIIDINTGAITEYDNTFDIINYDDTNDLMLVNTNGSYYLVDPEDPETLINPFERANN